MMPVTRLSLMMATILLSGLSMAHAAGNSEFGQFFSNIAPAALQDTTEPAIAAVPDDLSAEELNEIAPAAGIAPVPDNIMEQERGEQIETPALHTGADHGDK